MGPAFMAPQNSVVTITLVHLHLNPFCLLTPRPLRQVERLPGKQKGIVSARDPLCDRKYGHVYFERARSAPSAF
jgi:hypothetical protein